MADELAAALARIAELEARLGLAEDQIEALNLSVYRQQNQMDQLQAQFRLLYSQVRAGQGEAETSTDPRSELPPHY